MPSRDEDDDDELAISEALIGEDIADPDAEPAYDDTKPMRIAVIGRPNAGKSTLINALIGEERLLTGPEAGITRDSISVDWEWRGRAIKLFDTAGMRRKAKVQEKLEKLSVADGLRAIRFAEVVIVVLDSTIPFEKQDLQLADLIIREGRALVIAFNKWDLIEHPQEMLAELREKTARLLPQVRGVLAVPVSAETGRGLDKLMDAVLKTHKIWNSRISTGAAESLARGHCCTSPAARGRRPPPQDKIHHPGQDEAARLRAVLHAAGRSAAILHPLSGQRAARNFRHSGRADPHVDPRLRKSLRFAGQKPQIMRRAAAAGEHIPAASLPLTLHQG